MRSQSQVTTYSPRKVNERTKDYQSQRNLKKYIMLQHIEREPVMNQQKLTSTLSLIFIVYICSTLLCTVCRGKAHSK